MVPSNAPVFSVFATEVPPSLIRLVDSAGAEHPFTRAAFEASPLGPITFLVPSAPLAEGSYTVEYLDGCPATLQPPHSVPFRVGGPVAVPKTAGTLSATARKFVAAAEAVDSVELRVTFTPSESQVGYQRFTRLAFELDGAVRRTYEFGEVEAGRTDLPIRVACSERDARTLEYDDRAASGPPTVAGKHRFTAKMLIAGAPAIEPATLDVDVDCAKNVVTLNGATTLPVEGRTPDDASSEAGGCRMAGSSTTAGSWATLGIALACLVSLRRRRA